MVISMVDPTFKEIEPYLHEHERGLIKDIAMKHHTTIHDIKVKLGELALRTYLEKVISLAIGKPYDKLPRELRGMLRIYAMHLCLPIFWAVVREKQDIPTLKDLLEATPRKVLDDIRKMYELLKETIKEVPQNVV